MDEEKCPSCGELMDFGPVIQHGREHVYHLAVCPKCNSEWRLWYKVKFCYIEGLNERSLVNGARIG